MPFGVDEAGRGPVLGSMFVAGVWLPDAALLPDGVADSKTLAAAVRDRLADRIDRIDGVRTSVVEVDTAAIDDPQVDLNTLTVQAHAAAIDDLVDGHESGVCDACDTDPARFRRRVLEATTATVDLEARHGADETDPLVAAASVLAKCARENHVASLRERFGAVGSGYPSDPTTRSFLERHLEETGTLPSCARRSWKTSRDLLATAEQTELPR